MDWFLRNRKGGEEAFIGEGNTATEDTCSNSRESPALTRRDQSPQQRQADLRELFTAQINTESTPEADKKTVMS